MTTRLEDTWEDNQKGKILIRNELQVINSTSSTTLCNINMYMETHRWKATGVSQRMRICSTLSLAVWIVTLVVARTIKPTDKLVSVHQHCSGERLEAGAFKCSSVWRCRIDSRDVECRPHESSNTSTWRVQRHQTNQNQRCRPLPVRDVSGFRQRVKKMTHTL